MSYQYPQCIFIILLFSKNVTADACSLDVKVTQTLQNEGFHRNLTYGIVFSKEDEADDWINQDCIIALDQTLPPGVYVKPDQLGDLRRTNKLNAISKNIVNDEQPSEQSEESSVYIMGLVSESKAYLWLPVHARYHEPVTGGGMAKNEIVPPKIYLRCPDQRLDVCGKAISPSVTFLCNGSSREKCSWKEIAFTMMTDTLVWEVPIGDREQMLAIAIATFMSFTAATKFLFKILHECKMKMKRL